MYFQKRIYLEIIWAVFYVYIQSSDLSRKPAKKAESSPSIENDFHFNWQLQYTHQLPKYDLCPLCGEVVFNKIVVPDETVEYYEMVFVPYAGKLFSM